MNLPNLAPGSNETAPDVQRFLRLLAPDSTDGFIELRSLPSGAQAFCRPEDSDAIAAFIAAHRRENLYMGVATRLNALSGRLENCGALSALFADIDFKDIAEREARVALTECPLPPTIVIHSGNGLHAYWVLREPIDLTQNEERQHAKALLRRLAIFLHADLNSAEPARILRLPDTKNFKYDPPRAVAVESFDEARAYNLGEFDWLPAEPAAPLHNGFHVPEKIRAGGRNATLYRTGRSLKAKGLSRVAIAAALSAENTAKCDPPLDHGEVEHIAESVWTQPDRPEFAQHRDETNAHAPGSESGPFEAPSSGPFRIEDGRIVRTRQTKEGPVTEPLCNFSATVTEEIALDDGAEVTRAFLISGRLATGEALPPARVPVAKFASMNWVPEHYGLRAIVRAGSTCRDYLREAIQHLSPNAIRRQVFTHTGWREVDGQSIYLHAGGAIGTGAPVEVDLGQDLARYTLPAEPRNICEAMRASLDLLTVAPLSVTALLWAGTFRAPLASARPLDLSLWIEGQTGSLKSTLVALFLSHFGNFDRTNLTPWSSTANQLERRAFLLKDAVFVVDDWAPSSLDARELDTKAARLLRAQGNLAGRGRLRSDLSERPGFPPRGLIVSTGEQHPAGQSLLARLLLVELHREGVDLPALTAAQRNRQLLSHAMAGYLQWLAPQMPDLPALLADSFEAARERAASAGGEHMRVPEAVAHMWLGLDGGLQFAEDAGAVSSSEADKIRGEGWDVLCQLGAAQAGLVEELRPTRQFLVTLAAVLAQGKVKVFPRHDPGAADPRDEVIGWADADFLYLLPELSYRAVAAFSRESGYPFSTSPDRLKRDFAKEGLSQSEDGRHTAVVRIREKSKRVLKLGLAAVQELIGQDIPVTNVTAVTGF